MVYCTYAGLHANCTAQSCAGCVHCVDNVVAAMLIRMGYPVAIVKALMILKSSMLPHKGQTREEEQTERQKAANSYNKETHGNSYLEPLG